MIKPTSQAAYDALDKPTLDDRVYDCLRRNKDIFTRRELAHSMNEQASTISGSINRLIKAGVVHVAGTVECNITGRTVEAIMPVEEL